MADTYDRRVQIDASRHRYQDAQDLRKAGRWNGAIYLGGYAIECSLKALICYEGCTRNLKDTRMFKQGMTGAALHNLGQLREASKIFKNAIDLDRTGKLKSAWAIIVDLWHMEELRYGRALGHQFECERFLEAVEVLYSVILIAQKEGW